MALIEWCDDYSVGLEIFDTEHKKLIAIINEIHDSFARGVDRSVAERALVELVDYTMVHFGHEERFFDEYSYPDKAAHVIAHQQLREQVFEYRDSILTKGGIELALELIAFLRFWLLAHIMSDDKKFCRFLRDKGLR